MKTKILHEADGKQIFAVILATGDEAMSCLANFAKDQRIGGAQITAIGALERATLAYFDWEKKKYQPIEVGEQVEVASLIGDIAIGPDGTSSIHAHAVLGKRNGAAVAGHLQKALVRPTLEIIVTESPGHLQEERRRRVSRHQPEHRGRRIVRPGGRRNLLVLPSEPKGLFHRARDAVLSLYIVGIPVSTLSCRAGTGGSKQAAVTAINCFARVSTNPILWSACTQAGPRLRRSGKCPPISGNGSADIGA